MGTDSPTKLSRPTDHHSVYSSGAAKRK